MENIKCDNYEPILNTKVVSAIGIDMKERTDDGFDFQSPDLFTYYGHKWSFKCLNSKYFIRDRFARTDQKTFTLLRTRRYDMMLSRKIRPVVARLYPNEFVRHLIYPSNALVPHFGLFLPFDDFRSG